jgi:hypothetical protein
MAEMINLLPPVKIIRERIRSRYKQLIDSCQIEANYIITETVN